ncbi:MAG: Ca-activated chloride channel family protein, partial [Candidatus Paceibacteria bacterium]
MDMKQKIGKSRWLAGHRKPLLGLAAGVLGLLASPAHAQHTNRPAFDWSRVSHVIMPQARAFSLSQGQRGVTITRVDARVQIRERIARTTLDIRLTNGGHSDSDAVLLLPVPDGAVVTDFLFDGSALEPTARLLPHGEARRTYDDIVRRLKDPALLEFAGYNLIRSSVFPVPAGGRQHLRLSYEHILDVDGDRVDYILPRSEALSNSVPWTIDVTIDELRPLSVAYSPSHPLMKKALDPAGKRLQLSSPHLAEPGPFRLSYLLEGVGLSASLLAHPDPATGEGTFLLMAGLPVRAAGSGERLPREVTLVL